MPGVRWRGAHARIILLDAGMPLPVRSGTFEEVANVRSVGGAISDVDGVVELPVVGVREHLIEVEGAGAGGVRPAQRAEGRVGLSAQGRVAGRAG